MAHYIGIDIGSTSTKTAVLNEDKKPVLSFVIPTGWSSIDTAETVKLRLEEAGIFPDGSTCIATGYGRVSVPYADKTVTEITCHARGAMFLFDAEDLTVIDIGGQDTKIIRTESDRKRRKKREHRFCRGGLYCKKSCVTGKTFGGRGRQGLPDRRTL